MTEIEDVLGKNKGDQITLSEYVISMPVISR